MEQVWGGVVLLPNGWVDIFEFLTGSFEEFVPEFVIGGFLVV